jgi:hypothetical protein
MACKMKRDTSGDNDFVAPAGPPSVTLVFTADSPLYRLVSATYEDAPVPVVNDSTVSFEVKPGITLLDVVQVCPDIKTTVHISEDCGDGTQQKLRDRRFLKLDGYRISSI